MTEVIKANTDADFLAMVPAVIGYHAQNSLVCVAFSGKSTCGGFRLDLPQRRRNSDYRLIANHVVGMLSRMSGATRVAPIIYTDATFEKENGVPWVAFARYLEERLLADGFSIASVLCVAKDAWGNYADLEHLREGRPLDDIENSAMSKNPLVRKAPKLDEWMTLPTVTERQIRQFRGHTLAMVRGRINGFEELLDLDQVDFVERTAESASLSFAEATMLLLYAQSPARRDEMMLQAAFGELTGRAVVADSEHYHRLQRQSGQSMDEVVQTEMQAGRHSELGGLIMGEGTMRPTVERVERMIVHLKQICALAEPDTLPPVYCMLAWLLWSRGLGSAAGHFVDRALDIDPEYGMALVLYSLFASGRLPEWAFASGVRR